METRTQEDRATFLLEKLKPELLKLLTGTPAFGSVGIEFILHDSEVTRVISRVEVSRKPRTGGAIC